MSPVIVPPPYFRAPARRIVLYILKKPITGKKICQPFSALLRPPLYRLLQFGPSMFYYQATNLLGPKHSLASVASYTPILAAQRRITKAYIVPFSLLAALQSSLIILLQVPLKNSPDFQYKINDFSLKQAFQAVFTGLLSSIVRYGAVFMVVVGVFLVGSCRYGIVFIIVGRYLQWQYGASVGSVGISARDLIGSHGILVRGLSVQVAVQYQ